MTSHKSWTNVLFRFIQALDFVFSNVHKARPSALPRTWLYDSKKFRENFKIITCDDGCENLDFEGIERSTINKGKRTKVYYTHPYSLWEKVLTRMQTSLFAVSFQKVLKSANFLMRELR